MEELVITISWEWALGVIITIFGAILTICGTLITIAWKGGSRFTALETSMEWVKRTLDELKVNSDNQASGQPAFASNSPVSLTPTGEIWLSDSGLKKYIDTKRTDFIRKCTDKRDSNPYEVQKHIFSFFDHVPLETDFEDRLKEFAFNKGTTIAVMRRVGAIYFRDLCLTEFGMEKGDIDTFSPSTDS